MTAVESSKLLPGMLPPFRSSEFNQFSMENIGNKENASQRPELQTGVARGHTSSANTVQPAAPIQIAPLATRQRPAVQQNNPRNGIRGRKRTITLVDGENIDLSAGFMADPQIIEAMRERIIQLEDELEVLRHQPPPAKRARIDPGVNSNASAAASSSAGLSTSSGKSSAAVDDKKKKMQLRKIFDQLKRQCKSDSCKFQGSPKTIKIDEVLEPAEFDAIFKGKGVLIQPTPQNKPKSVVTIMTFSNQTQISELFGDELKQLKGNHWTKGGFQGRFGLFGGGSSNFAKSVKTGSCDVTLLSIEANYSKNNLKCSLKCTVAEDGYNSHGSYSDWDSD